MWCCGSWFSQLPRYPGRFYCRAILKVDWEISDLTVKPPVTIQVIIYMISGLWCPRGRAGRLGPLALTKKSVGWPEPGGVSRPPHCILMPNQLVGCGRVFGGLIPKSQSFTLRLTGFVFNGV